MFKKTLSLTIIVSFFITSLGPLPCAHADTVLGLPAPGTMINLSPAYQPVIMRGLTVHKDNPFLFDFIVDVGQDRMSGEPLKKEGEKLIKYFLASLAIPDKDFWVNLSPYEKDKIIPEALSQTDMGRDLLEQDYILKQMTASLIYPEKQLGKTFWDKVYAKAQSQFGTTQIPVNTFNKVWIMADRAEVFEHNQTAFVVDQHLKVMLEEDYLALQKHSSSVIARSQQGDEAISERTTNTHSISSQVIKQIILPELEKEVNTGKNFANLRQIFNSIILSSWYKNNLKQALLNQVYADKSKVKGIDLNDPTIKQQIYEQYLKAYKKGVFNYIKEDVFPRKYFSGGILKIGVASKPTKTVDAAVLAQAYAGWDQEVVINAGVDINNPALLKDANAAMTVTVVAQSQTNPPIEFLVGAKQQGKYKTSHFSLQMEGLLPVNVNLIFNPYESEGYQLLFRGEKFFVKDKLVVDFQENGSYRVSTGNTDEKTKGLVRVVFNNNQSSDALEMIVINSTDKPLKISSDTAMTVIEVIIDGFKQAQEAHDERTFWGLQGDLERLMKENTLPELGSIVKAILNLAIQEIPSGKTNSSWYIGVANGINPRIIDIDRRHSEIWVQVSRKDSRMNDWIKWTDELAQEMVSDALEQHSGVLVNLVERVKSTDILGLHGLQPFLNAVKEAYRNELTPQADDVNQTREIKKLFLNEMLAQTVHPGGLEEAVRAGANILVSSEMLAKDEIQKARAVFLKQPQRHVVIIAGVDNTKSFKDAQAQIIEAIRYGADGIKITPAAKTAEQLAQTKEILLWAKKQYPQAILMVAGGVKATNRRVFVGVIAGIGPGTVAEIRAISAWNFFRHEPIGIILNRLKVDLPVMSTFGRDRYQKMVGDFEDHIPFLNGYSLTIIKQTGEDAFMLHDSQGGHVATIFYPASEHHLIKDILIDAGVKDSAMKAKTDSAVDFTRGGIDLNITNGMQTVIRDGRGVEMTVDSAFTEHIRRIGIDSLSPVIFRITPVTSIWPLIGLQAPA